MNPVIVRCSGCGQQNRVKMRHGPVCGRCKKSLVADFVDVMMEAADQRREDNLREIEQCLSEAANRLSQRRSGN